MRLEGSRRSKALLGLSVLALSPQPLFWSYTVGLLFGSSWTDDQGSAAHLAGTAGAKVRVFMLLGLLFSLCFLCMFLDICIMFLPSWFLAVYTPITYKGLHPTLDWYIPEFANDKPKLSATQPRPSTSPKQDGIRQLVTFLILFVFFSLVVLQIYLVGPTFFVHFIVFVIEHVEAVTNRVWLFTAEYYYHAWRGLGCVLAMTCVSFLVGLNTASLNVTLEALRFINGYLRKSRDDHAPSQLSAAHKKRLKIWMASHFGLMNVGLALLYYSYSYDENGTFKPSWTENLG